MTPPGPPAAIDDEWGSWEALLVQFSQATACTASLRTIDGGVAIGPLHANAVGAALGAHGFFEPEGAGALFERTLGEQAALRLEPVQAMFLEQLAVAVVPIIIFGRCFGTVSFGWVPVTFPTALGAEQVGRAAGIDGRKLWGLLRLLPPLGRARLDLYVGFLTSLLATHARLRETLVEIDAANRMREENLARIAHELRTPLSSVLLRLSALLNTRLDDPHATRTALEAISRNVRDESRMIDDIVDSARSRTGQLSITRVPCDVRGVVDAAVVTIAPQAQAKGVAIEVLADDGAPPIVEGDPGRLQQAFWNVLANAVKFTPAQGRVTIRHAAREGMHDVSIQDTGAGIRRALVGRIFEPFVRERANNDTGLGLGLAIARHIVELHGGHILVDSDGEGLGTTFTIALPAREAS